MFLEVLDAASLCGFADLVLDPFFGFSPVVMLDGAFAGYLDFGVSLVADKPTNVGFRMKVSIRIPSRSTPLAEDDTT